MYLIHENLMRQTDHYLDTAFKYRDVLDTQAALAALSKAEVVLGRLYEMTDDPELRKQRLSQLEKIKKLSDLWREYPEPERQTKKSKNEKSAKVQEQETNHDSKQSDPLKKEVKTEEKSKKGFDLIAGLEEVKEEIRLRMLLPFEQPELFTKWGLSAGGGVLLYGPPGTGKTMIAKAAAEELNARFFSIKVSDLMSKWVGETEKNIADLFEKARSFPRSVIFIDEIEALLPARGKNQSTIMKRVVPQFLAELDGFDVNKDSLLFIGNTNEPWELDKAATRPGRFDIQIYVSLPDLAARQHMLSLYLVGKPLTAGVDLAELAQRLEGFSGADIKGFCDRLAKEGLTRDLVGQDARISMEMIEETLEDVRPSVKRAELKEYEKYRLDHGG